MSITIDDIAIKCGLSRSTVSRVLRNHPSVSEKARLRVEAAIAETGYQPNQIAQSLAQGYSNTVALIIGNISSTSQIEMVKEIQKRLYSAHLMTWLCNSDYSPKLCSAYLDTVVANKLAGAILITTNIPAKKLREFSLSSIPVVLIHQQELTIPCDSILGNDQRAAYNAVNYLLERGHRNIALLCSYRTRITSYNSYLGYCAALRDNGLTADESNVYEVGIDNYSDTLKARQPFDATPIFRNPEITAVICTSNEVVTEFYRQCYKSGKKVPQDLSLVSLDPVNSDPFPEISFCAFGTDQRMLGQAAVEQILTRIQARSKSAQKSSLAASSNIMLDTIFVEGNSVKRLSRAASI